MPKLDVSILETEGYAAVPYPVGLRVKVHEAVSAWRNFCDLPNDIKQRASYFGEQNTVSGIGYELQLLEGATKDLKEDFHLRLSSRDSLEEEARKIGDIATTFVEKGLELDELMMPVVEDFAGAVEEYFKMPNFLADVKAMSQKTVIRFLHYFGDRSIGDELAVPHVDKGGFTLHLYESHPGLEYFNKKRAWKPMVFSDAETAIIPAMRTQYRSHGQLKATCHRVIANKESSKEGRFSVVCFVNFIGTPYYDKVRGGRLPEKPIGFNYDMSFSEFAKLFTSE